MHLRWIVIVFFAAHLLAACGGGSGSADTQPTSGSNWDEMVWDEGSWE